MNKQQLWTEPLKICCKAYMEINWRHEIKLYLKPNLPTIQFKIPRARLLSISSTVKLLNIYLIWPSYSREKSIAMPQASLLSKYKMSKMMWDKDWRTPTWGTRPRPIRRERRIFEDDMVMVYLQKKIPTRSYNKLRPRKHGPFKILKNNDDAYIVDLPSKMSMSKRFNVADLHKFYPTEQLYPNYNSRTSSFDEEETDVGGQAIGLPISLTSLWLQVLNSKLRLPRKQKRRQGICSGYQQALRIEASFWTQLQYAWGSIPEDPTWGEVETPMPQADVDSEANGKGCVLWHGQAPPCSQSFEGESRGYWGPENDTTILCHGLVRKKPSSESKDRISKTSFATPPTEIIGAKAGVVWYMFLSIFIDDSSPFTHLVSVQKRPRDIVIPDGDAHAMEQTKKKGKKSHLISGSNIAPIIDKSAKIGEEVRLFKIQTMALEMTDAQNEHQGEFSITGPGGDAPREDRVLVRSSNLTLQSSPRKVLWLLTESRRPMRTWGRM